MSYNRGELNNAVTPSDENLAGNRTERSVCWHFPRSLASICFKIPILTGLDFENNAINYRDTIFLLNLTTALLLNVPVKMTKIEV